MHFDFLSRDFEDEGDGAAVEEDLDISHGGADFTLPGQTVFWHLGDTFFSSMVMRWAEGGRPRSRSA